MERSIGQLKKGDINVKKNKKNIIQLICTLFSNRKLKYHYLKMVNIYWHMDQTSSKFAAMYIHSFKKKVAISHVTGKYNIFNATKGCKN